MAPEAATSVAKRWTAELLRPEQQSYQSVGTYFRGDIRTEHGEIVALIPEAHDDAQSVAAAHLLAAAPDLLAAAKGIALHQRVGDVHSIDWARLRLAIAKAEGRES